MVQGVRIRKGNRVAVAWACFGHGLGGVSELFQGGRKKKKPTFLFFQWYNLGRTGGSLFGQRRWASTRELSLFSGSRNWNGTGSAALLPLLKASERYLTSHPRRGSFSHLCSLLDSIPAEAPRRGLRCGFSQGCLPSIPSDLI